MIIQRDSTILAPFHITYNREFSPKHPLSGAETPFNVSSLVTTSALSTRWFCLSVTKRKWSCLNSMKLFSMFACWELWIRLRISQAGLSLFICHHTGLSQSLRGRANWLFVWVGQNIWHFIPYTNVGSETWHFKSALRDWERRAERWVFLAL